MVFTPKVGNVVKIRNWHGVILDITFTADDKPAILQVQTPRNVFRNMGPEFIDIRLSPDEVRLASREDLDKEIEFRRSLLDASLVELLTAVKKDVRIAA